MRHSFLFLSLFFLCLTGINAQKSPLQINAERLEAQLQKLSTFGMNSKGGNDRVAFSDYDLAARAYLTEYLTALGLTVEIDAAANLIAKKKGKDHE